MKIIKSHLRSPIKKERLSGLVIISVENDIACSVDYSDIIDHFARIQVEQYECVEIPYLFSP